MAPRGEGEVHADPAGRSGEQSISDHRYYEFTKIYANEKLASAVELATNQDKLKPPFDVVAVCIPTLVMLFFLLRWKAIDTAILQVATYTKKLERLFEVPKGFGWETFVARERGERKDALAKSTRGYW